MASYRPLRHYEAAGGLNRAGGCHKMSLNPRITSLMDSLIEVMPGQGACNGGGERNDNQRCSAANRLIEVVIMCFAKVISVLFLTSVCTGTIVFAEEERAPLAPAEEVLVERISRTVLERLEDDNLLEEKIASGIDAYIERQREKQARVRKKDHEERQRLAKNVIRPKSDDHIFGARDAPLSLIEYSDFECPYCKQFHKVAQQLVAAMPGEVNWIYRHFPLGFHNPGAQKQAEASECVAELGGNEAFWQYIDTLYERTRSGGRGFPESALAPLAAEIGLDRTAFSECLNSERMAGRVKVQHQGGLSAGIRGTPGNILLNNQTGEVEVFAGAAAFEQIKAAVERLLSQ